MKSASSLTIAIMRPSNRHESTMPLSRRSTRRVLKASFPENVAFTGSVSTQTTVSRLDVPAPAVTP
jgi:hypothetical protein